MSRMILAFLGLILFSFIKSQLLLDNVPMEFQFAGNVSYVPTSGGIKIDGYSLKIGYAKHQWIGVKFMQLTSQSNYDILIFKRSTVSNQGSYQCTVSDFYASAARPNYLMSDSVNNMDKQVSTLSSSNHFALEIYRTKGNTNGQDWTGTQFTKICFFTSDSTFNKDSWNAQYQNCYGFILKNYVSTWVAYQINSNAFIDGVKSKIYGGLSGPSLKLDLYVYRPNPILSGSQITIRIGDLISNQVGYDFQRCLTNKGDYFGNTTADLQKDLIYSGYNDNDCQVTITSTSLVLYFTRYLNTYDDFDNIIKQKTRFCFIIGSNQNCHDITPRITYPIMQVQSAIKIYQNKLIFTFILLIFILFSF